MTIEAVRRKSTRARREERDALPIGETDANIFNCPACARPLAVGTSRCPGCSTRFIGGIRATRAVGFMAIGLVAGLVIGGGTMGLAAILTAAPATTATVVDPAAVVPTAAAPGATVAIPSAGGGPVVDPAVPTAAVTALRQSTLVNQRLVADAARLTAALDGSQPATVDIARALRALSATAAFGDRIAPGVAAWDDGATVSAGLVAFYAAVGGTAREGLAASLTNERAYLDAGRAMLTVMAGLPALQEEARTLAATADLELPPLAGATSAP